MVFTVISIVLTIDANADFQWVRGFVRLVVSNSDVEYLDVLYAIHEWTWLPYWALCSALIAIGVRRGQLGGTAIAATSFLLGDLIGHEISSRVLHTYLETFGERGRATKDVITWMELSLYCVSPMLARGAFIDLGLAMRDADTGHWERWRELQRAAVLFVRAVVGKSPRK